MISRNLGTFDGERRSRSRGFREDTVSAGRALASLLTVAALLFVASLVAGAF